MSKYIDHLKNLGVKTIYFCAGSSNSDLLGDFKSANFELIFHYDERGSSFRALGQAKASNVPVAICVTSGTAVAECLPAVVEAFYGHEKLIVVSADRPSSLRHSFAPQAIDQTQIFSNFLRSQTLLDAKKTDCPKIASVDYPYQINIEISRGHTAKYTVEKMDLAQFELLLRKSKSPLLVLTEGEYSSGVVEALSKTKIPIYQECTSNIKTDLKTITDEFQIMTAIADKKIDLIIKLGKTPFGKIWRVLETEYNSTPVVALNSDRTGLSHGSTVDLTDSELASLLINEKLDFSKYNDRNYVTSLLEKYPKSEPAILKSLQDTFQENSVVFLGNSMTIRNWQLVFERQHTYYANRGANGIDGQLATAIGIAESSNETVYCILGDLTFFYDFASALVDLPMNLFVYVVNNGGGRIFEQVFAPKDMLCEHVLSIEKITSGLNSQFFEIIPCNEQNSLFWSELGAVWK